MIASLLLLVLFCYDSRCFKFSCKYSIEKQAGFFSYKIPDRFGCVAKIESYDGEEATMTSFDLTAVEKYNMSSETNGASSRLMKFFGSKPMTAITEVVKINGHRFEEHPEGIGSIFSSITNFTLSNGILWRLRKEDLKQFPNVAVLDYNDNKIRYLETGLFTYTPKLNMVGFQYNDIKEISQQLGLEKLPLLFVFGIYENPCTKEVTYLCDYINENCPPILDEVMAELTRDCPEVEYQLITDLKSEVNFADKDLMLAQNRESEISNYIRKFELHMEGMTKNLPVLQTFVNDEAVKTKMFELKITEIHQELALLNDVIDRVSAMILLIYEESKQEKK